MKSLRFLLLLPLLLAALCLSAGAEGEGFALHSLTATEGDASVSVRLTASDSCTLAAALYDGDGRVLTAATKPVAPGERQTVTVSLPDRIPADSVVRAFLLDGVKAPLCPSLRADSRPGGGGAAGALTVSGGRAGTDYRYADGVLTVLTSAPLTIRNEDPDVPAEETILIPTGVSADLTLAGVNLDASGIVPGSRENGVPDYRAAALRIEEDSPADVTITLAAGTENILRSGDNAAGLQKMSGRDSGTLTIRGEGTLTAVGGYSGAGIGAGLGIMDTETGAMISNAWNITIESGTVTAVSGLDGAGIGGGACHYRSEENASGNLTILGGTVTAESTGYGAGIGGGDGGAAELITIAGGRVTATGMTGGAGIGGGSSGSFGGADARGLHISGGSVFARGGVLGAGVGAGYRGSCIGVRVTGGTLIAVGGQGAAGVGGCFRVGDLPMGLTVSGNGAVLAVGGYDTGSGRQGAAAGSGVTIDYSGGEPDCFNGAESETALSGGVLFRGLQGQVKGSITLTEDLTVPAGHTLTIPAGASLTMAEGAVLTNLGTIVELGSLSGTVTGDGQRLSQAPEPGQTGDFTVTGGAYGTDYRYETGVLTVLSGTPLTVTSRADGSTGTGDVIRVRAGVKADLSLRGVYIDAREAGQAALSLSDGGGTVTLTGDSRLFSGGTHAGLESAGPLTLTGTGSLEAYGSGGGAGIGSAAGTDAAGITIESGTVTARGGAGIGAGDGGQQASVTIRGGDVAASVGGAGGSVTVSGGIVNRRLGNSTEASLGGDGSTVTVSGGQVSGVISGKGIDIRISGGTVSSIQDLGGENARIRISGGTVVSDTNGAYDAIGGKNSETVITGGRVTARGAAGIGTGTELYMGQPVTAKVTVTGGVVIAESSSSGPGIGLPAASLGDLTIGGSAVIFARGGESESLNNILRAAAIGTPIPRDRKSDGTEAPDDGWSGLVFKNGAGRLYGTSLTLKEDVTIPADCVLTLAAGQTLVIPDGVTLTNRGTIHAAAADCVRGTVTGNQPVIP